MVTRLIVFLGLCLAPFLSSAQKAQSIVPVDSLVKQVQRLINNQQSDSLYLLMGDNFKRKVSAQQMKQVASQMNEQLGKWELYEKKANKDGITTYKTKFERATIDLLISQDVYGKIETLLFKPAQD